MNKMDYNLDTNIKNYLGNIELLPQIITPEYFRFFGNNLLAARTAKIYTLICNISKYHETTSDAIRWLCMNIEIETEINVLPITPVINVYDNIKEYILDVDNKDEETLAFWLFEDKSQESKFLSDCRKIQKYSDILLIGKSYGFDIYNNAELILAAVFGECVFISLDHNSEFERPLIAAIIYAKLISLNLIPAKSVYNNNNDNYGEETES